MLICIEGPDGSGKTTVAKRAAEHLVGAEYLRFPRYGSKTGQLIKAYLNHGWELRANPSLAVENVAEARAFQALQVCNRLEVIDDLRAAAGSATTHLVLDRYWPSGWVYGQLDGLETAWLDQVHRTLPSLDLAVLLDLPAEETVRRRVERDGATAERYEALPLDRHRRVRILYLRLWARSGPWWRIVDATESPDEVFDRARGCLTELTAPAPAVRRFVPMW